MIQERVMCKRNSDRCKRVIQETNNYILVIDNKIEWKNIAADELLLSILRQWDFCSVCWIWPGEGSI